ncbi:hypothetical protein JAAARDRAFT_369468 [Jaapia argillacea MUCL 33604]|uniref:Uncharacterized protein n=1 Tax=Jaapia argillacea MUCL 33604 TaxID=933084 RepID=A0A067QAG3_9AGAM|nr:hypothetical protein JAAARDRAFT_369468 [Jaapia argillacea MUCL 33604]
MVPGCDVVPLILSLPFPVLLYFWLSFLARYLVLPRHGYLSGLRGLSMSPYHLLLFSISSLRASLTNTSGFLVGCFPKERLPSPCHGNTGTSGTIGIRPCSILKPTALVDNIGDELFSQFGFLKGLLATDFRRRRTVSRKLDAQIQLLLRTTGIWMKFVPVDLQLEVWRHTYLSGDFVSSVLLVVPWQNVTHQTLDLLSTPPEASVLAVNDIGHMGKSLPA